jgi:hypothetical protein
MAAPGSDLDVALAELEARLERLRSLYEQYFIGIEKIEPSIPRQDVDRRIYALRKVQIRNTAKRFKLQNIIQRYNTFQQYWLRICREIENGTYHRHVARAQSRFGDVGLTAAAKRRARLGNRTDEEQKEAADQITRARESAEGDLAALLDEDPEAALRNALAAAEQVVVKATPLASAGAPSEPAAGLGAAPPADGGAPSADAAKPGEGVVLSARPQLPPRLSAKGRQALPVEIPAGVTSPATAGTAASSAPAGAGNGPSISPSQAPQPGARAPGAPPPRKSRGGEPARADGRAGEPTLSAPPAAVAQPAVANARTSPVAVGNAGAPLAPAASPVGATGAAKRPFPRPVRHDTAASAAPPAARSPAVGGGQPVAAPPAEAEPAAAAAPRRVSKAPAPRRPTVAPAAAAARAAPAVVNAKPPEPEPAATPAARAPAARAPSITPANAALAPTAGDAAKRRRSAAPARRSAAPAKASLPPGAKDQKAKEPRVDSWAALRVPANPQRASTVGGKAPAAAPAPAAPAEPRADAMLRRNSGQHPAASVEPAPGKRTAAASKPQTLPPATQASREVEPRAQVVAPVPAQAAPAVASPAAARPVARSEPSAASEGPDPAAAAAAARTAAARAADLRAQSREAATSRLDEQRLNQLHGTLVAERRRLNQPGKISLEALGTSLRETETKLKKQYAGKAIDFHVVVKDGKAVVKPIIG